MVKVLILFRSIVADRGNSQGQGRGRGVSKGQGKDRAKIVIEVLRLSLRFDRFMELI